MKRQWTKRFAGLLAALMLLPAPSALAAGDANAEQGEDVPAPNTAAVEVANENSSKVKFDTTDNTELKKGGTMTYTVIVEEGHELESISINVMQAGTQSPPAKPSIKLDKKTLSGTDEKGAITATLDAWPTLSNTCKLKLTAGELTENLKVTVGAYAPSKTNKVVINEVFDAKVAGDGDFANGKKVTVSVTPHERYELSSLELSYAYPDKTVSATISSSTDWNGFKISWNPTGQTTIVGPLYGNLTVTANVIKTPITHKVQIYTGDGVSLDRPTNETTIVNEGESLSVRVECENGYLIDQMMLQVGKTYANWAPGQSYFMINFDRVQVRESNGAISFVLPEITDDITIEFNTAYDQENIPITLKEEDSHVHITSDVSETVARGTDATFTIASTSSRYSVNKISVQIGSSRASVNTDRESIRVGKRNYEIRNNGNGEYVLYIDNIREPVTVSATTNGSGSVSRPSLTINSSSNMRITKSVSGSTISEGDSVRFYFTPYRNHQIEEITLQVGRDKRSVSADKTSVSVGGRTYTMSRDSSGVVTLYMDNVVQNVTVSGRAYYTRDPITPTNVLSLNKNSGIAFMNGYTDGTFRPNAKMTRAEAVVMLHRLCDSTMDTGEIGGFYDVPANMWCAREINSFAKAGIIETGTYFYPNQFITRGEFVEMLYRLEGSPSVGTGGTQFKDTSGTPYDSAIRYAVSRGWVNGYTNGMFRPYGSISRSEIAAVMTRVLNRTSVGVATNYRDVPSTHWAYRYVQMASSYV